MPAKRAHVFYHVPFENLAAIQPWLQTHGWTISQTRWDLGERAPERESFDWLIVMGGPMGVHDEKEFPWLRDEKQAIRGAITAGKPVLGICLGAQLIADVLGAAVTRNAHQEIGWLSVELEEKAQATWLHQAMPESLLTFHWHGDTFGLPPKASRLAFSAGCANQGYVYEDKVVGLQFHPEVLPEGIAALLRHCASDLKAGPYVQSPEQITGHPEYFSANRVFLEELLSGMASRA